MDHLEGVGRGLPYRGPALPVVAVPTTAGTGSEATRNAVITERGPQGYKRSFRDERLVPADAVVDPDLLATAPRPLIAANGLDALTQLLEAYTSQRATPVTDALARAGLASVREGLLPGTRTRPAPSAGGPQARWPMPPCCPASASPTPGSVLSTAWPVHWGAAADPSRHGLRGGPVADHRGQRHGPGRARTGCTGPRAIRGCRTHPGRPAPRAAATMRHAAALTDDAARLGGTPGGTRACRPSA